MESILSFAQQHISRSGPELEEQMTKLWKHLGKLDDFRNVLYQLLDLGSRLTGVFQLITANAIHQNRAGWKAGLSTQGVGQKFSPDGRVLEKFLKDPKDDEAVVNLLVKGLQEQIEKLTKYKSKGQSNQYNDNAPEIAEPESESSEKDTASDDSSSSSSKKKKTRKHKRHQEKKKKSRRSKSTSSEPSRVQRKNRKEQKNKRSKATKASSDEDSNEKSNNFYKSEKVAATPKPAEKKPKRKQKLI